MLKAKAVINQNISEKVIIDEITIKDPLPEQVVVKIISSGICGSQLLSLQHPKIERPQLLGHEAIGKIVKIGNKVKHLKEGDTVLISWLPYNPTKDTEYIQWCDVGWKNKIIKSIIFTWSDYSILHNQFVSKIPDNLDKYNGSIIGCAVATGAGSVNNIGNLNKNHSVAVFGAGGLGAGICGLIADQYGIAKIFPALSIFLLPAVGLSWLLKIYINR